MIKIYSYKNRVSSFMSIWLHDLIIQQPVEDLHSNLSF